MRRFGTGLVLFAVAALAFAGQGCKARQAGETGNATSPQDPKASGAGGREDLGRGLVEAFKTGSPDKFMALFFTKDFLVEVLKVSDLGMGETRKAKFAGRLDWLMEQLATKGPELLKDITEAGKAMGIDWSAIEFEAVVGEPDRTVKPPVENQRIWVVFRSDDKYFAIKSEDCVSMNGGRVYLKEPKMPSPVVKAEGMYFVVGPSTYKEAYSLQTVTCEPPDDGHRTCRVELVGRPDMEGSDPDFHAKWRTVTKDGIEIDDGRLDSVVDRTDVAKDRAAAEKNSTSVPPLRFKIPTDARMVVLGY